MRKVVTDIDEYVYVVHGIVPELMPRVACRREKHFKTKNKKIIKCPYCRGIFTIVEQTAKVEIYRHSVKTKIIYHDSMPCRTCHNKVGIIYSAV